MKLSRFLISAAGLLFVSSHSFAADIYTNESAIGEGSFKDEPVYYAPVFNWAGLYAGIHGGYASGDANYEFSNFSHFNDAPGDRFDLQPEGGFGGVHLGYNFQGGNLVYGIEGTLSGADIKDQDASKFYPDADTFKTSTGVLGTVAARMGYAWDRTLLYAKGGYAAADVEFEAIDKVNNVTFKDQQVMHGAVLGAGVEHAIVDKWIVGIEYNYVDLGNKQLTGFDSGGDAFDADSDVDLHSVAAKVSYKFGSETRAPLK